MSVIHVAGIAVESDAGMIQRCAVCGEMLIDNRNINVSEGSSGPRSFEPYAWVERNGPGLSIVTEDYVDQHVDRCCDPDMTKKAFRYVASIASGALGFSSPGIGAPFELSFVYGPLRRIHQYAEAKGK